MNLDKVLGRRFPQQEHTLTPRDCMLYALGVGVGTRPQAQEDLQFTYEDGLKVFPAMVNVICHPGAWVKEPELEIDWVKILHGEQSFKILEALAPGNTYVGSYRVADVIDKGPGKGAMLYLEKSLTDKATGRIVSVVRGRGVVDIGSVSAEVGAHDHFGVPADMTSTIRQSGVEALVLLDAVLVERR